MHFFLHIGPLFSSGRGFFLALSAAGQAGDPRVLTAQVWAPAGLRRACSGRSKSLDLARNHWIAFRLAEPCRTMETPLLFFPLCCCCIMSVSHRPSSSLLCGSDGTTSVAHEALPFVTATDGASVCARARTMFPMGTNTS